MLKTLLLEKDEACPAPGPSGHGYGQAVRTCPALKSVDRIQKILMKLFPGAPQIGHFSGGSFSTVFPQTGQT